MGSRSIESMGCKLLSLKRLPLTLRYLKRESGTYLVLMTTNILFQSDNTTRLFLDLRNPIGMDLEEKPKIKVEMVPLYFRLDIVPNGLIATKTFHSEYSVFFKAEYAVPLVSSDGPVEEENHVINQRTIY